MFRWQTILWNIAIWIWCFMFVIMKNFDAQVRLIPLVLLFVTVLLLAALIFAQPQKTKTTLLFLAWCFFVTLGVFLKTTEHYSEEGLNIHIMVFTVIGSAIWCLIGHSDNVTEPGTYWFVWSLTIVVSLAAVFNDESHAAIVLYIVNTAMVFCIHAIYIFKIYRDQAENNRRCKQLFRVMASATMSLSMLISSVLFKTSIIDDSEWDTVIPMIMVLVLLFIVIDGAIGFSQRAINTYEHCPQVEP